MGRSRCLRTVSIPFFSDEAATVESGDQFVFFVRNRDLERLERTGPGQHSGLGIQCTAGRRLEKRHAALDRDRRFLLLRIARDGEGEIGQSKIHAPLGDSDRVEMTRLDVQFDLGIAGSDFDNLDSDDFGRESVVLEAFEQFFFGNFLHEEGR